MKVKKRNKRKMPCQQQKNPRSIKSIGLCREAVAQTCSVGKVFLEILQNSQENTCARVSISLKLQANFIKTETLAPVFSCEFSKISKNTFSYRTPQVAASVSFVLCPRDFCVLCPRDLQFKRYMQKRALFLVCKDSS